MSFLRDDVVSLLPVCVERLPNLFAKSEDTLLAALSCYEKCAVLKVDIVQIYADQLADADARPQEQRQNGDIAYARCLMKAALSGG